MLPILGTSQTGTAQPHALTGCKPDPRARRPGLPVAPWNGRLATVTLDTGDQSRQRPGAPLVRQEFGSFVELLLPWERS